MNKENLIELMRRCRVPERTEMFTSTTGKGSLEPNIQERLIENNVGSFQSTYLVFVKRTPILLFDAIGAKSPYDLVRSFSNLSGGKKGGLPLIYVCDGINYFIRNGKVYDITDVFSNVNVGVVLDYRSREFVRMPDEEFNKSLDARFFPKNISNFIKRAELLQQIQSSITQRYGFWFRQPRGELRIFAKNIYDYLAKEF